ncbi:hypothetical protein L3X38_027789 [Prunus dulcis]|uniref:Uncharacterized protein n=1 Tax=Prunus dulcis TaxID=3755 RepID=A0AAD4VQH3_PRUDU|nr:hypothetical protein L3X38_027789 [Prunus dulcis]
MKTQADKHRFEREFQVGDMVYLRLCPDGSALTDADFDPEPDPDPDSDPDPDFEDDPDLDFEDDPDLDFEDDLDPDPDYEDDPDSTPKTTPTQNLSLIQTLILISTPTPTSTQSQIPIPIPTQPVSYASSAAQIMTSRLTTPTHGPDCTFCEIRGSIGGYFDKGDFQ